MKITVYGMWHLGCVTAACLADRHDVLALDDDAVLIDCIARGDLPVAEPGLSNLFEERFGKTLSVSSDFRSACAIADIVWVAFDTPVSEMDVADVDHVMRKIERAAIAAQDGAVIIISSQLPAGSVAKAQAYTREHCPGKTLHFVCVPENLRLGRAIECFTRADRYIVGADSEHASRLVESLLTDYTSEIIKVSIQSAEMSKHALNCFLALCVAYTNELARLCEIAGADAAEVERCLKSDKRIGAGAYLSPGSAFSGGTLARDASYLGAMISEWSLDLPLIPAILRSNDNHKLWPIHALHRALGGLAESKVAVLGLTYKAGTDTLRRSLSLEVCSKLLSECAEVHAYDPAVQKLPEEFSSIQLHSSAADAVRGSDAVVILTPWPEFKTIGADFFRGGKVRAVVDPAGLLRAQLTNTGLAYYCTGFERKEANT